MGQDKQTKKPAKKPVKRAKKKTNFYFTDKTQAAIVSFQECKDVKTREKLYRYEILPAFDKLSENLILMHNFLGLYKTHEELKNDCVAFLYEKLDKFDESRGTKAFSYFNVVAKNWLIINSKQRVKQLKRHVSIQSTSLDRDTWELIEKHQIVPPQDEMIISREKSESILKLLYRIKKKLKNKNEAKCIDSIIILFQNQHELDFLNKRAIFLYLRELSGLNAKQLTITMSSIKKHYRELSRSDLFDLF